MSLPGLLGKLLDANSKTQHLSLEGPLRQAGDRAFLTGLEERHDLNGRVVRLVEAKEDDTQRARLWTCEVERDGFGNPAEKVKVAETRLALSRPPDVSEEKLAEGEMTARMSPVKSGRLDLNGRPVRLLEWNSASARWQVETLGPDGEKLSVRLNRLEAVRAAGPRTAKRGRMGVAGRVRLVRLLAAVAFARGAASSRGARACLSLSPLSQAWPGLVAWHATLSLSRARSLSLPLSLSLSPSLSPSLPPSISLPLSHHLSHHLSLSLSLSVSPGAASLRCSPLASAAKGRDAELRKVR